MVLITASAGNVYVAGNLVSTGLVSSTNIMTMWPVRENQGSKYLMYDPSSKEVTSVSQVSIPGGSAGQVLTTYGNNVTYWSNITSANDGLLSVTAGSHLSGGFSFSANQADNTTVTITTDATSSNTGGTIVARDANGNFSANTITMDSITLPSSIATGDLLFCDPNQKVGGTIKVVYDSDKNSIAFNGDVIFNGNTVIMHSNNLTVDDSIVQLGNSATVSSITDLGLLMAQPVGQSNVAAVYHGGTKQYVIAYTDSSVSSAQVVPTGNIAAIVYGNVTATQGFLGDGGQLSNLSSVANGSYGIPVITMQGGRITSMSNSVTTGTGSVVLSNSAVISLTNATGLPIATGVSGLGSGVSTFLGNAFTQTGTGAVVFGTSPSLTTPNLGTPSALTLTNATGLPISTGISGMATGAATFLATPSSANFATLVTDKTGTGNVVLSTNPILVTPNIGTPSAAILTNATGLPISTGVSGLATGISAFLQTASAVDLWQAVPETSGSGDLVFSNGAVFNSPVLGTPTSVTLTNATGLPISTGVSGMATGAATFLATPTSANFATLVTDETGTGNVVLSTNPILVTPNLGTPSTLIGTNISGTAGNLTTGNAIALNTTSSAAGTRYFPLLGTAASGNGVRPYGSTYLSFLAGGVGRGTLSTNIYQVYEQTGGNFWNVQSVSNTLTFTAPVASGSVSANLAASSGYLLSNITGLGSGVSTFLGNAFTQTGTGAVVFGTSPSLITPNLGTPASGDLTNCTGTATNVVSGASSTQTVAASATNATFYPSFYSATTGNLPALVDADLTYNPSTSTLTVPSVATNVTGGINVNVNTNNATMYPTFVTGTSGIRGIGVNSTIKINPATGVLTVPSITTSLATSNELPISTGVSGLGTGVAAFLANPTSLNLANMVTDESGTGAIVFANSPALVTPDLGTPSALVGTNITGTAADFTANVSLYTNVMANTTTNQVFNISSYPIGTGALQTYAGDILTFNPAATNNPNPAGNSVTHCQFKIGKAGASNGSLLIHGGTPYIHSLNSNVYGIYMSNAAAANGWTPSMIFNYGATAGGSYRDGAVYVPNGIQLGSSGNSQDPGINLYGTLDMYDITGNGAYSHVYMNSNTVRWRMYSSGNPQADVFVVSSSSQMTLYGSDASLKLYDSVTGTQSVKHGFANGNVFCQFYRGTGTTYTNVYTVSNVGNMTLAGTLNANLSPSTGYQVSNVAGMAAGVASFLTTPTSLNLANIVTDETGTGTLIFSTNPTFGSNITVTNNVNALNFVQNGNTMPAYANGTLSSNALIPIRFGANSPYNVVDIKVRLSSLSAGSSNVFLGGREASNVVTLRENSERFDIYNGITGNTFTTGLALWRAEAAGIDHMINIQLVRSPSAFSGYPPTSNGGRVQYRTDSVYTAATFGATTGRTWGNITSSAGYLSAITLHSASTFSGTWSTVHYL